MRRFRRTPLGVLRVKADEVLVIVGPPTMTTDEAAMVERAFAIEGVRSIIMGGGLSVAGVVQLSPDELAALPPLRGLPDSIEGVELDPATWRPPDAA